MHKKSCSPSCVVFSEKAADPAEEVVQPQELAGPKTHAELSRFMQVQINLQYFTSKCPGPRQYCLFFFSRPRPAHNNNSSAFSARHARSCQGGCTVVPVVLPRRLPPKHGICTPGVPFQPTEPERACKHRREVLIPFAPHAWTTASVAFHGNSMTPVALGLFAGVYFSC